MDLLDRNGCRLRMWGSNYWKEWMAAVGLSDDGVCVDDFYIVEGDDDVSYCVDAKEDVLCGPCDEEDSEAGNQTVVVS